MSAAEVPPVAPPAPAASVPAPQPPAPPSIAAPSEQQELLARLRAIESENRTRQVREEHGLNSKQAAEVTRFMDKHSLPAEQAKMLAASANPELFKQENPADFPASHMTSRPSVSLPPGEKPEVNPEEEHWKKLRGITHSEKAKKALVNTLGHWAAEAVGLAHKHELTPL